jgi:hypothetical protein
MAAHRAPADAACNPWGEFKRRRRGRPGGAEQIVRLNTHRTLAQQPLLLCESQCNQTQCLME